MVYIIFKVVMYGTSYGTNMNALPDQPLSISGRCEPAIFGAGLLLTRAAQIQDGGSSMIFWGIV